MLLSKDKLSNFHITVNQIEKASREPCTKTPAKRKSKDKKIITHNVVKCYSYIEVFKNIFFHNAGQCDQF